MTHRLKVGDRVIVADDNFRNEPGVIVEDDETFVPFRVLLDNTKHRHFNENGSWFLHAEVKPILTPETAQAQPWETLEAAAEVAYSSMEYNLQGQLQNLAARLKAEAAAAPKPSLAEVAERAAEQFESYARQHTAKNTDDGRAKAEVNSRWAADLRAALERETEK